jgi:hypothetical protein
MGHGPIVLQFLRAWTLNDAGRVIVWVGRGLYWPPMKAAPTEPAEPRLSGTYVTVMVLEAAIIVALWILGRIYS